MLWEELAWTNFRELNKELPVVVPLGACEQYGPHLPVYVDTFQVTQIGRRVEAQLVDELLLTPTLWLGSSRHHKDFPGTISVRPSLFSQMGAAASCGRCVDLGTDGQSHWYHRNCHGYRIKAKSA